MCIRDSYSDVQKDTVDNRIDAEKEKLKKYSLHYWEKYVQKEKQDIHVLVLTKVIDDALVWLFQEDELPEQPSETL